MYEATYDFKLNEPFLVPFSNIPYIYNGSISYQMRGASCFALFILEQQERKKDIRNTVDYLFSEDECTIEMSISSKQTIENRLALTQEFYDKHFSFLGDVEYQDFAKLFVFTAFLDQLATDCYSYIEFLDPTTNHFIDAFQNIALLSQYKGFSMDKVAKYKKELLDVLSIHKPNAYFAILFNAA